jgi:SAM-dependent methyltransferase
VAYGFDVVAVEPQEPLRRVLADKVGPERVRDGVAEQIPLEDASVVAVMIADAFHWFDRRRALGEIRRVLARGGGLALFNTLPDWTGASWAHELGTVVATARPEHPHFDGQPWQESVREAGGFGEPWEIRVTTYTPADPERVLAHMASMSWIAGLPESERVEVLGRMRAAVDGGETPEQFPMHFEVGLTKLLSA